MFQISERVDSGTKVVENAIYDAFKIRPNQVIQGKGTSNTRNLSRKCFEDPREFARALDIDDELVSNIELF